MGYVVHCFTNMNFLHGLCSPLANTREKLKSHRVLSIQNSGDCWQWTGSPKSCCASVAQKIVLEKEERETSPEELKLLGAN